LSSSRLGTPDSISSFSVLLAVVEVIVLWVVATAATSATTLALSNFERGYTNGDKQSVRLLLALGQMIT
jgi:hypothetical protein